MGRRRAAAAAASDLARLAVRCACVVACVALTAGRARADGAGLSDDAILGPPRAQSAPSLRLASVTSRMTAFEQDGRGYQSQAGPALGPGSERLTVFEPQIDAVLKHGDRFTHRVFVPVDVITAASPDAIDRARRPPDVLSGASRHNEAGTVDWTATYRADRATQTDVSLRNGLHLEEDFRSWHGGLAVSRAFADGATVVSASALEVLDWFDRFDITGHRHGRTSRSSTTGGAGVTQILTPTTIVAASYGVTVQTGELGNTWNSVPLAASARGPEILPPVRVRHAIVGKASQALPWNGALRVHYRFYSDTWGIAAHSAEGMLLQRVAPFLYVGALLRVHRQTGADFYTTFAGIPAARRTADSDLAPLDSRTVGGKVVSDLPLDGPGPRLLHLEIGYERYSRSNDLWMNVLTCATGYVF